MGDNRQGDPYKRIQHGPDNGQFDFIRRDESPLTSLTLPARDVLESAATATTGDELWPSVTHPDPLVRGEAAANPYLTDQQLERLLTDPHWVVRYELAREQPRPGVAAVLANDPDPVVRAAATERWDLPDEERERLAADPAVVRVLRTVSAN